MKAYTPIETDKAPQAIGPYSQGVCYQDLIFLSGQIGLDPSTQAIHIGFEAQCRQIFKNIEALLRAADSDWDHLLKCTIYLTDLAEFALLNDLMQDYLKAPFPGRAVVGVQALPKGALVEIDCIAIKSKNFQKS